MAASPVAVDLDNPPFPLTPLDREILSTPAADFVPHDWANLTALLADNRLDLLKRTPPDLLAYLAWSARTKAEYGTVTAYLLRQRLHWTPLPAVTTTTGDNEQAAALNRLRFTVVDSSDPFGNPSDRRILANDWPYALEPGAHHLIVWLKNELPSDAATGGDLTPAARTTVEAFITRTFRVPLHEKNPGDKVLWFRNWAALRSIGSVEHVHVVVRGIQDETLLKTWEQ